MKINSSLIREWTKQPDGNNGYSITVDSNNLIYLYSNYSINKFSNSGELYWNKTIVDVLSASDISVDSNGNTYIIGDSGSTRDSVSNLNHYAFIKKFNSNGIRQWTKVSGVNSRITYGYGIRSDSSGNIFTTGKTTENLNSVTNSGGYDLYIEKFNTSGTKQWTKLIGSSSNDVGNRINIDSSGNIYVTGYTEGIVDGGIFKGSRDLVVAKFNSSGTQQWVSQLGDTYSEGKDVATDSSGNVYVVGYANGDFDGNSNIGLTDIIIAK